MMAGREFLVTWTVDHSATFREGYGVLVDITYSDDTDNIDEILVTVVPIAQDLVSIIGNVPCIPGPESGFGGWVPVENFLVDPKPTNGDTIDLRSRFFDSWDEAVDYARDLETTWERPEPWQSFIELG